MGALQGALDAPHLGVHVSRRLKEKDLFKTSLLDEAILNIFLRKACHQVLPMTLETHSLLGSTGMRPSHPPTTS